MLIVGAANKITSTGEEKRIYGRATANKVELFNIYEKKAGIFGYTPVTTKKLILYLAKKPEPDDLIIVGTRSLHESVLDPRTYAPPIRTEISWGLTIDREIRLFDNFYFMKSALPIYDIANIARMNTFSIYVKYFEDMALSDKAIVGGEVITQIFERSSKGVISGPLGEKTTVKWGIEEDEVVSASEKIITYMGVILGFGIIPRITLPRITLPKLPADITIPKWKIEVSSLILNIGYPMDFKYEGI
jgi:hypothetical protein